jgi:hypothetical protein
MAPYYIEYTTFIQQTPAAYLEQELKHESDREVFFPCLMNGEVVV